MWLITAAWKVNSGKFVTGCAEKNVEVGKRGRTGKQQMGVPSPAPNVA
jgi:hypothetical protein